MDHNPGKEAPEVAFLESALRGAISQDASTSISNRWMTMSPCDFASVGNIGNSRVSLATFWR